MPDEVIYMMDFILLFSDEVILNGGS